MASGRRSPRADRRARCRWSSEIDVEAPPAPPEQRIPLLGLPLDKRAAALRPGSRRDRPPRIARARSRKPACQGRPGRPPHWRGRSAALRRGRSCPRPHSIPPQWPRRAPSSARSEARARACAAACRRAPRPSRHRARQPAPASRSASPALAVLLLPQLPEQLGREDRVDHADDRDDQLRRAGQPPSRSKSV